MSAGTNPGQINYTTSGLISDIMHDHYTGQESSFDGTDINAIVNIFNGHGMANTSTFASTLPTPAGIYMLTISD